ncbi:DUF6301 family protein [Nocardia sp. NPDC101769]|uniref:DUF6301 family protein n=1 Tax=Nocardia sp. NPDC101769 TaxID=3364333 RepID=UPI003812C516
MQADIEGAVRAVKIARTFTWTWAKADIERFVLHAGWTLLDRGDYGSATLSTDLRVNLNRGSSYSDRRYIRGREGRDESLQRLTAYVTDVVRQADEALTVALSEAFDQLTEGLIQELGSPSHLVSKPEAEVGWVESHVVINVVTHKTFLLLEIVNPRYWIERQQLEDED